MASAPLAFGFADRAHNGLPDSIYDRPAAPAESGFAAE